MSLRTALVALSACLIVVCDAEAQTDEERRTGLNSVIFAGFDGGQSLYGSAGFKRGLGVPVDQSGFTLLGIGGYGRNDKRDAFSPTGRRRTDTAEMQALIGFQSLGQPIGWAVHVGARAQQREERPAPDDLRTETRFGPALLIDLWGSPWAGTRAEFSSALSTVRGSLWARGSLGFIMSEWAIDIGPEVAAYRDRDSSEAKIGIHLSHIPLGPVRLRASGGWAFREVDDSGFYLGLSGYARL